MDSNMKALFITNALGFTSDIREVAGLCRINGIILLEDNCEALGTETLWGKTGNFGAASTFSFFVAHHMSTIEGGMVCTNDGELAQMLRIVRANGWDRNLTPVQQKALRSKHKIRNEFESKYTFYDLAFNLRPTEITGFLGQHQLHFIDEAIKLRERNYLEIESAMAKNDDLILINRTYQKQLSPFAIPVICKNSELRNEYLLKFFEAGIEVRPMIAGNIQKQPFYKKYVKTCADLANATFLHDNSFYCGNYPEMTQEDLETIKSALL
jgi:CDP-6-deoxy-D-xylo-4-hexulose-3-dehydrase